MWLWQVIRQRPRLLAGVLCGAVTAILLPYAGGITRSIVAWDAGVAAYLGLSLVLFSTERMDRIALDAAAQQEGEWTIFWLTMAAVAFSFVAILGEFAGVKQLPSEQHGTHVLLVAVTLFLSWLMTHTTFAFRYAHEYYQVEADGVGITGGLDFPQEPRPDYLDFMYFALVIGMTFQVSDVQITSRKFRRLATVQGVLAFLYNTIIVALTVNLAASLL